MPNSNNLWHSGKEEAENEEEGGETEGEEREGRGEKEEELHTNYQRRQFRINK